MSRFQYEIIDLRGERRTGEVTAASREDAVRQLTHRAKAILAVSRAAETVAFRPVSPHALTLFFRQLETMLAAAVPIHRAMRCLAETENANLRAVLLHMGQRIEGGWSLSQAMQEQVSVFSPLNVALVQTGEEAGALEETLGRIADYMERTHRLRQKVISTLAYPAVVGIACMGLLALFVVVLIPRMESIFADLGADLPWLTRAVVGAAHFFGHPLVILVMVALVLAVPFLYRAGRRLGFFRDFVDQLLLTLPVVGPLTQRIVASQMLNAWATLLESGIPFGPKMGVVGAVSGNRAVARAFLEAQEKMRQGTEIYLAVQEVPVFAPMVVQMIKVGEESGTLDRMLRKVAIIYEEDVANGLETLAGLLEPLIMFVMGTLVGLMALAIALPVMNLVQQL